MSKPVPAEFLRVLEAASAAYPHVVRDLNLAGLSMSGIDLTELWFVGCTFDDADMRDSLPYRCHLIESSFRGTDLSAANMGRTETLRSTFVGARFSGASLLRLDATDTDFHDADLTETVLTKTHLRESDLRGVSLRNARFSRTSFVEVLLAGADLTGATGTINGGVEINVGTPEHPVMLAGHGAMEWLRDAGADLTWSRTPEEVAESVARRPRAPGPPSNGSPPETEKRP